MNRGIEIASDVADSSRSLILDQVSNGLAIRMAVLYLLISSRGAGQALSPTPARENAGRTVPAENRLEESLPIQK
ncbi:MAG: hypothetical protein WKF30_05075 [Pyrinomonadaceae bacterium]